VINKALDSVEVQTKTEEARADNNCIEVEDGNDNS
jgi:hypothetical protein